MADILIDVRDPLQIGPRVIDDAVVSHLADSVALLAGIVNLDPHGSIREESQSQVELFLETVRRRVIPDSGCGSRLLSCLLRLG